MIANTRNDRKCRHKDGSSRKGKDKPKKWGDLSTMDFLHFTKAWTKNKTRAEQREYHKESRHEKEITGIGNRSMALNYCDAATGHLFTYCCSQRSEDNVSYALKMNAGREPMRHIYSDTAQEFRSTCRKQGIPWQGSTPGRHQSNAIIEQLNGEILRRVRVLLQQAGMPACLWPWAIRYATFAHNTNLGHMADGEELPGESPYFKRHEEDPIHEGRNYEKLYFGQGVFFRPTKTTSGPAKAGPRMKYGIFLGYELAPGGKWTGQYYIADLHDLADKDLHADASPREFPFAPHVTRTVKVGRQAKAFPLEARYTIQNTTVEGIENHKRCIDKWSKKPLLKDNVEEEDDRLPDEGHHVPTDDVEGPIEEKDLNIEELPHLMKELQDDGYIGL